MIKRAVTTACATILIGVLTASVAAAVPAAGDPVTFTAHMTFQDPPAPADFTGTIPGCTSGTVIDSAGGPTFTPWGGVFVGVKSFTCAGGEGGFDVRLKARFSESGSTGTWNVIGGWGTLDGLKGSGSLVGIVTEDGIDDIYTGAIR